MKNIKFILSFLLLIAITISCAIEDGIDGDTSFIKTASSNGIDALFDISDDNSGIVKITPTGTGVTSFNIKFGHGTGDNASTIVGPGKSATHIYPEGTYSVDVVGSDVAGGTSTATFPFTITYRAPENLSVTINKNVYTVKVKATAKYAASYVVYFGDVANETGTPFGAGEEVQHTYAGGGAYDIKVVALSGGAATTESVTSIVIFDPLALPYTCELASQNYLAGGTFGGVNYSIVDNPFSSGINTSAKVVKFEKPVGVAEWAGTWKPLDVPIDLSTGTIIKMTVYATEVGKNIGLELQASTNGAPNTVIFAPVTAADQWVDVIFDTTTNPNIPAGATFKQFNINYNRPNAGEGEIIYIDNIRLE